LQSTKRSEKACEPDSLPNFRIKGIVGHFKAICDGFRHPLSTPAFIGLRNNLTLTIKNRNGTEMLNPTSKLAPIVKKTKSFVMALRESLERRFSPMLCDGNYVLGNHISNIISSNYFICFLSFPSGTILDPRFKKGWIKFSGYSEASVLESVKAEIQLRYRALRMF
jgi:hypothetical protein